MGVAAGRVPGAGRGRPGIAGGGTRWLMAMGGLLCLYLGLPFLALPLALLRHPTPPAIPLGLPLLVSLGTAAAATLIVGALGVPLGYLLARGRGVGAAVLGVVVQLPLAVPPLVGGLLLLGLFGPYTPLGRVLPITDTLAGIVAAQAFVAAPFLIIAARSAFAAVDPDTLGVAATLGLGPGATFARVALPAAWPGVRAGLGLAFVRAFGEFGATLVLAYHPYGLPVATWVAFAATGLNAALPAAGLAVLAAAAALVGLEWMGGFRPRGPLVTDPPLPVVVAALPPAPLRLTVAAVHARLGDFELVLDRSPRGARLALLGPSGAGKSMALKVLAGLLPPTAGRIEWSGEVWTGPDGSLGPEGRQVGYVPQHGALFPHLDASGHLAFGLRHLRAADRSYQVGEWLRRLDLVPLRGRRPHELSGGQRQRVAIGRALAPHPRLLLLDEPFSALDAPLRRELQQVLLAATTLPWILVTHDPAEAARLADEVWVLIGGRIAQSGSPEALRRRPNGPAVARALGIANIFVAGAAPWPDPPACRPGGGWCLRPEAVHVLDPAAAQPPGLRVCRARLRVAAPTSGGYEFTLVPLGEGPVIIAAAGPRPEVPTEPGTACLMGYDPDEACVW